MTGRASEVGRGMGLLLRHGPAKGHYPEPAKSILICRPDDQEAAKTILADCKFQCLTGSRYLGGLLGSTDALEEWLAPKIAEWTDGAQRLPKIARRYPQTAFAGMTKSLQMEWQYLQRVLPDCGAAFQPIEDALRQDFTPDCLV